MKKDASRNKLKKHSSEKTYSEVKVLLSIELGDLTSN